MSIANQHLDQMQTDYLQLHFVNTELGKVYICSFFLKSYLMDSLWPNEAFLGTSSLNEICSSLKMISLLYP